MNIVVEVITEYLRSNRRVVIPTFGAIMVKDSGERIFSNLLNEDDGLLVALLRDRGLSEMEAAVTLDRFIFEVRHELEQYGYCRLDELGTLRMEPETKTIRLFPPVYSGLSQQESYELKQTPYVPKPIEEPQSAKVEVVQPVEQQPQPTTKEKQKEVAKQEISKAQPKAKPQPKSKPRKRVDFVLILAALILMTALAVIGYGWYVSHLTTDDDAAMDALRVMPEQSINR